MQVPEEVVFNCGNCGWGQMVEIPKEKRKDHPVGRGYCMFEPPRVFPMPKQQGTLADIQGQTKMGVVPLMLDPVVDEDRAACGRYTPNSEMLKVLEAAQPEGGCGGCESEGAKCGCK
jgi:hypothetical protein